MRTTPLVPVILLSAAGAAIAACSGSVEVVDGDVSTTGQPIYGGTPATAPEHAAVVSLHQRVGTTVYAKPFCSGTLISPSVVLTAAHCLDVAPGLKPKFDTMSPNAVAVYFGDAPATDPDGVVYPVAETKIHPRFKRLALLNDIALLRLSADVTEVAPVPHLPSALGFTEADVGSNLNFAGFGYDDQGQYGQKLQVDLPLGGLGCSVAGCPTGGDPGTQISYAQQTGGPCTGDSGGPAFIDRNGSPYVGGVTSFGDGACVLYGVSTRTDAFDAWIDEFMAAGSGPDCSADGTCNSECAPGEDPDCGGGGECAPIGASCSADADCCTHKCKGRVPKATCRG